jgi:hypothetical protein
MNLRAGLLPRCASVALITKVRVVILSRSHRMRSSLNQGKPESNCDFVYNCALQIGRELIKSRLSRNPLQSVPVNANMDASTTDKAAVLNLEAYPTAKKLVQRCYQFFAEVQDLYADLSFPPFPGRRKYSLAKFLSKTMDWLSFCHLPPWEKEHQAKI